MYLDILCILTLATKQSCYNNSKRNTVKKKLTMPCDSHGILVPVNLLMEINNDLREV